MFQGYVAVICTYQIFVNFWVKRTKKLAAFRNWRSSRTQGPALVCLSAIDKKSVYWTTSWARILNVQDIIKKRTKETSSNISSTCIPSTTVAGAGQHSFNTGLLYTRYRACMPTHQIPAQCWASVSAHCWFNAGQLSATLVQHLSITRSVVYFAQTGGIQPKVFRY